MKRIIYMSVVMFCFISLKATPHSPRVFLLRESLHPRSLTARTMAGSGTLLMHCVRPLDRVGFVVVLASYTLQSDRH